MARRVAGGRPQAQLRTDFVVRLDQVHEPGIDDRLHGVVHVIEVVVAVGFLQHRPVLVLPASEEIAGIRKGGYPLAVDQPCIPTDMIEVQMRAEHEVDVIGSEARVLQVFEKVARHVRKDVELALAIGADTGVEHDAVLRRAHDEALEGDDHLAFRRREMRLQPGVLEHGRRRGVGQQHRDVVFPVVHLDDARDLHVTDVPAAHRFNGHSIPSFRDVPIQPV